jgi:hypothetical protein
VFEHAQDRRQRTSASVYGFATRHYKSHLSSEPQRCVRRSAATSPEPKKARPERLVLYERLAELVLAAFSWRRSCWRSSRVIRERLIIERLQLWSKVLDADQPLSRIVSAASFVENFTEQGFQSEVFLDWLRFRSTLGSRQRHDLGHERRWFRTTPSDSGWGLPGAWAPGRLSRSTAALRTGRSVSVPYAPTAPA